MITKDTKMNKTKLIEKIMVVEEVGCLKDNCPYLNALQTITSNECFINANEFLCRRQAEKILDIIQENIEVKFDD